MFKKYIMEHQIQDGGQQEADEGALRAPQM